MGLTVKVTPTEIEEWCQLYDAGWSFKAIGRYAGRDDSTVSRFLAPSGRVARTTSRSYSLPRDVLDCIDTRLRARQSTYEIAASQHGVSPYWLRRVITKRRQGRNVEELEYRIAMLEQSRKIIEKQLYPRQKARAQWPGGPDYLRASLERTIAGLEYEHAAVSSEIAEACAHLGAA